MRFGVEAFDELAEEVAFCLENIRHPDCTVPQAGRFYEDSSACLRAHGILRLLIDASPQKFSSDLVMSGHARRAWLRRCKAASFANYYSALSRSGALFDAVAGDDMTLAESIFELSPVDWMRGDEYEEDFLYQRYLGLLVMGAPEPDRAALLTRFEATAPDDEARLEICRAIELGVAEGFDDAFQNLLRTRRREIAEDPAVSEELPAAIGAKVFIEGVAIVKLARQRAIQVALQYPMCPALSLVQQSPASPPDEFANP